MNVPTTLLGSTDKLTPIVGKPPYPVNSGGNSCRSRGASAGSGDAGALQIARDLGPELEGPAPNGFIADVDAALSEQLFDITKTQGQSEI